MKLTILILLLLLPLTFMKKPTQKINNQTTHKTNVPHLSGNGGNKGSVDTSGYVPTQPNMGGPGAHVYIYPKK